MPSYFAADFVCELCEERWDELIDRAVKDEAVEVICPNCTATQSLKRSISSPMVMNASLPDGQRMKRDDGLRKMREASKLELEMLNKRPADRKELKEQVTRLKETTEGRVKREYKEKMKGKRQ